MALSESDLFGAPSNTLLSDAQWNHRPNSDQRVFASADGTFRAENQVIVDPSVTIAAADYVALLTTTKKIFSSLLRQSSPCCLGSQDEEYVGRDPSGHNVISICWQNGDIVEALLVTTTGPADGYLAESLAMSQDLKIASGGS